MANYNGCEVIDSAISGMVSKMNTLNNKVKLIELTYRVTKISGNHVHF